MVAVKIGRRGVLSQHGGRFGRSLRLGDLGRGVLGLHGVNGIAWYIAWIMAWLRALGLVLLAAAPLRVVDFAP